MENNISIKTNDSKEDNTSRAGIVLCQICYEKKIDCNFLPCGHVIQESRALVSLVLIAGKESLQHTLLMFVAMCLVYFPAATASNDNDNNILGSMIAQALWSMDDRWRKGQILRGKTD